MRITTDLDVEKRIVTVTIHTDDESFKMKFELDKVTHELKTISNNPLALKILDMLGFKIEIEKKEKTKSSG